MGKSITESRKSQISFWSRPLVVASCIGCIAVLGFVSWWWRYPPVDLDPRRYEVTLALCRVCNQRSLEGLDRIESELTNVENRTLPFDRAHVAIANAIKKARRGQWSDAERDCRKLLEDQVRR